MDNLAAEPHRRPLADVFVTRARPVAAENEEAFEAAVAEALARERLEGQA